MDLHYIVNHVSERESQSQDLRINRKTTLSALHYHREGEIVPYLCTGSDSGRPVGHIFTMAANYWENPTCNLAYSLGEPKGRNSTLVEVPFLKDRTGRLVPCIKSYATCQGMKVCPFTDPKQVSAPHVEHNQHSRQVYVSEQAQHTISHPQRDLFEKTIGLWASLRDYGCMALLSEATSLSEHEIHERNRIRATPEKARRGHQKRPTCEGRLGLGKLGENLVVRCEHYHKTKARRHMFKVVSHGEYHLEYFQALFDNDLTTCHRYESDMKSKGYGPLAVCHTVRNFSTVKVNCDNHHRESTSNDLVMAELIHQPCSSRFEVYQPIETHRIFCRQILVICRGPHTHPVPILMKTPPSIRADLLSFLESLDDLPNLTSRRLLRNKAGKTYLQNKLLHIASPTFADLHISFTNLDHLQVMIDLAQKRVFPAGTGWKGVLHMKEQQDASLSPEKRYIRAVEEYSAVVDDEDDTETGNPTGTPPH
ncbi:hypothetical protein PM082_023146 [Marasmius tenuissimus]|nr:hypothetical protein PM082_023146 [Marasmius tenuissimus]